MDLILAAGKAAAKTASNRHTQEIGVLIALVGGLVLVLSGVLGLFNAERWVERSATILAGVLLAVGMIVLFFGLHHS
jgi:hypothetical protein